MKENKNRGVGQAVKSRRKYDEDFKREALKMLDSGRSAQEVSSALGISEQLLYNWRNRRKHHADAEVVALREELEGMRKRLREVEQERDVLKKALHIFSRGS